MWLGWHFGVEQAWCPREQLLMAKISQEPALFDGAQIPRGSLMEGIKMEN
jgi:hypothetical protein